MEIFNGIAISLAIAVILWLLKMYRDNATKKDVSDLKYAFYSEMEILKDKNQDLKIEIIAMKKDIEHNREKHDEAIQELKADFKTVREMVQELLNRK